jgi:hypothetical protein
LTSLPFSDFVQSLLPSMKLLLQVHDKATGETYSRQEWRKYANNANGGTNMNNRDLADFALPNRKGRLVAGLFPKPSLAWIITS